jgi:RNA polymerase sigma factor (sigma-70 family)
VEGYTLRQQPLAALRGPSPLLRLASDERLIELTRKGQQAAFEVLVARYHARLLAFCRHMLRSREDAEDVLQEVFAAAFNAIMADAREINARPWLYRIARNRSLNHLRRNTAIGVDSMDAHFADQGQSTSEKAHKREEFRLLLDDVGRLPETQRSALVLREMDALSYEQIAEAMDTTVPSVKSLLVRARIGLAEAAEARKLTCDEVRLELGAAAEGIAAVSAPVRRHVKDCDRCRAFRTQLRANNRALAAIFPLGPILLLKKTLLFKLGLAKFGAGGAGAGAAGATAGGGGVAAGSAAVATGGGLGSVAAGAVVVKAVAVVATVAIVAVGASKALDHHAAAPATGTPAGALRGSVASVPANAVAAAPPLLAVVHHAAFGHRRQIRLVALMPQLIHPSMAGTSAPPVTPATSATTVATTPSQPATTPTPAAATQTSTPAPTATPTTQEISTTTVFPSGSAGGGPTAATGTTGASTPAIGATGSTGAAGATGSTGAAGSTTPPPSGTTGATGSGGSASPSFSQDQGGSTAGAGASSAGQ